MAKFQEIPSSACEGCSWLTDTYACLSPAGVCINRPIGGTDATVQDVINALGPEPKPIIGRRVKIVSDGTCQGTKVTLADTGGELAVTRAEIVIDANDQLAKAKLWVKAPVSVTDTEITETEEAPCMNMNMAEQIVEAADLCKGNNEAELFRKFVRLDKMHWKARKRMEKELDAALEVLHLIPPCPLHENCLSGYKHWITSHLEVEDGK